MSDQAAAVIRELQNPRPLGQVVMIRQEKLEEEVMLQAGNIARALLTDSMKSMKTDDAREGFLRREIETILNQVGTIYQCTEVQVADDLSQAFVLFHC